MQAFTDARGPDTPDELWVLEHDPVFTLGQAGKWEHVLLPGEIPVVPVDRGGQVTYHGPGQIVAYPLFDLRRLKVGVRELVDRIEQAMVSHRWIGGGLARGCRTGANTGRAGKSGPGPEQATSHSGWHLDSCFAWSPTVENDSFDQREYAADRHD